MADGGPLFDKEIKASDLAVSSETAEERLKKPSLLDVAKEKPDGEKKVAKRLHDMWTAQDTRHRYYRQEWRINRARRLGISNVKLFKRDVDRADYYDVYAPPGVNVMPATLNKADRLSRRVVNFIFTDPPMPEALPSKNDDESRDTAEVTTRILQVITSEGRIDDLRTARRALDLACTYDSAFRHHYVDPNGGGNAPVELLCHPQATRVQEVFPQPLDPEGEMFLGPYITKYLKQNGELTDDVFADDLERQPKPAIRSEVLTGKNVRLTPATAMDIWEAEGVIIASYQPLSYLRSTYEKIGDMDTEEIEKLVKGSPINYRHILNRREREYLDNADHTDPDFPIFTLTHYRRQGGMEQRGIFAVMVGNDTLAHIQPWTDPVTGDSMDIPVDQFKQFESEESPYGRGLMRQLGGGNDLMGMGIDAFITHMERTKNRRVFLPTNSIIQPKQMQSPTMTTIPMNPGGKPEYEEVPPIPQEYFQFMGTIGDQMDDESGLQQAGQAVNAPSVKSALHARQIVEQVSVSLSDITQNTERALIRGYRIYCQLIRAFFDVPMEINVVGDDGAFKVERWSGSDFGDTTDIRISKGSFTQLSAPAKAAEAERYFAMVDPTTGERLMSIAELRQSILGNVGGLLGIRDDPVSLRVRRQIAAWERGPTEEFFPAFQEKQQAQQMMQQLQQIIQQNPEAQQNEQVQQMMQQAQQVLQKPLPTPFDPNPLDMEPQAARKRHFELTRIVASEKMHRQRPEWQTVLIDTYQQARQAAGVQTLQEQSQAAQQAKQQELQSEIQLEVAKINAKAQADMQKAGAVEQTKAAGQMGVAQMKSAAELQKELVKASAQTETAQIHALGKIAESEIDKDAVVIQAAASRGD